MSETKDSELLTDGLRPEDLRLDGLRPSWQEYFKDIVECTAKRSPCERLKVGCLLVKNNRIISTGYNGFLPGAIHKSIVVNDHEQATVHAEQNALMCCAKLGISCNESTLYTTHYPCIICCRLILAAGIKIIKYIHDYKNDPLVDYFCKELDVKIEKI
jgi:dCMP deaminase